MVLSTDQVQENLGDEVGRKGKQDNKDNHDKNDDPPSRSPNLDIKSAKRAKIPHIVIYHLRVTYGIQHTRILKPL
jgi:hypothetical protein